MEEEAKKALEKATTETMKATTGGTPPPVETMTTEAVETLATVVRLRRMYVRCTLGLYPYGARQKLPKRAKNVDGFW